jgi:4-oxalocrotonate tautomerase family enzyme
MPTITIAMDSTSPEIKKHLIEKLTSEASKITNYPPEFFYVYIQEYPAENIGAGGKTVKEIKSHN